LKPVPALARRILFLVAICMASVPAVEPSSAADERQPHFDARQQQVAYTGPGREAPPPEGVTEIPIGYFGPADSEHPDGGGIWVAANLAIEEANRAGGYQGLPFRLLPTWSKNPWGTGVALMARQVFGDAGVWAVIGSIDGSATHLAEQIAAKARITVINPAGTDKTVNLANVAWMFSCLPADDQQAPVLVQALVDRIKDDAFTLFSTTDHDSHHAVKEFLNVAARSGIVPFRHHQFAPGTTDLEPLITDAKAVVVIYANPGDSARLVLQLRAKQEQLQVFGGPALGRRLFVDHAGAAAEGSLFPLLCDLEKLDGRFSEAFASRTGREPDCTTAQAYDATRIVIEAIRQAGLNRVLIRDALEELSPWTGISGPLEWDSLGQNRRTVRLGTITAGAIIASITTPEGGIAPNRTLESVDD
jgi:branched-chain amino acid transport system substrate-binding protein